MISAPSLLAVLATCSLQAGYSSRTRATSGSYETFRRLHGRAALKERDTVSYEDRQSLFHRRKAAVNTHNARNLSWKMAVNQYSDYTDAELRTMLGYKRVGPSWSGRSAPAGASSLVERESEENFNMHGLASEIDFRGDLESASFVRNQGSCGSCWAVAAAGAMEMHMEKTGKPAKKLSYKQLVDCVPNPSHCGGTGGCKGATGELAFDYVVKRGLISEDVYQGSKGGSCDLQSPSELTVSRYVKLPENQAKPLYHALATKGPVVVSVDATDWQGYDSGVYAGCEKDTVVNHAVLAVGYGKDGGKSGKDYWLIRNSWGPDWGEHGHIRVERHMNDDYCGVDNDPQAGVFCEGGPKEVTVCGMCGITSDSSYPVLHAQSKATRNHQDRSVAPHLGQSAK